MSTQESGSFAGVTTISRYFARGGGWVRDTTVADVAPDSKMFWLYVHDHRAGTTWAAGIVAAAAEHVMVQAGEFRHDAMSSLVAAWRELQSIDQHSIGLEADVATSALLYLSTTDAKEHLLKMDGTPHFLLNVYTTKTGCVVRPMGILGGMEIMSINDLTDYCAKCHVLDEDAHPEWFA